MQIDPLFTDTRPAILLAEDDPDQSDMLREALEDEGYRVEAAFSGDVADRKLVDRRFDLVILDIRMPGLHGEAVMKAFRSRKNGKATPVIIVSAFASAADMERYQATGATASFAKPYSLDELLACIARLTERERKTHAQP
ncbi:MAG TPA: response regulator [Planctomycetota bacterium]|nr:response regulator [Planctomycetota bacterium]